jgi:hypothetical protein
VVHQFTFPLFCGPLFGPTFVCTLVGGKTSRLFSKKMLHTIIFTSLLDPGGVPMGVPLGGFRRPFSGVTTFNRGPDEKWFYIGGPFFWGGGGRGPHLLKKLTPILLRHYKFHHCVDPRRSTRLRLVIRFSAITIWKSFMTVSGSGRVRAVARSQTGGHCSVVQSPRGSHSARKGSPGRRQLACCQRKTGLELNVVMVFYLCV